MATDQPTVIFSSDSHCGPRMVEDLRPYCPSGYLDEFDRFATPFAAMQQLEPREFLKMTLAPLHGADWNSDPAREQHILDWYGRNSYTTGIYDMSERLREMDRDGVAAEVIFHGVVASSAIPWVSQPGVVAPDDERQAELLALGYHIYNQWLADWCATEPERHAGLAYIPLWDLDAALQEIQWARDAGLRGINFPTPRDAVDYSDPEWDPLWAACQDLEMPLTTHSGGVTGFPQRGAPVVARMVLFENGGWATRRGMAQMVFGGVFERFPRLALVLTEVAGGWWAPTMAELDSVHLDACDVSGDAGLTRLPSEYCATNVYIGASFMSDFEAEDAVTRGYTDNVIWGTDYPHIEGTWQAPRSDDEYPVTKAQLRFCYAQCPPEATRQMVGANGVKVYGLDGNALQSVADRIGAPSLDEIGTPLERVPDRDDVGRFSFRTVGPWY